MPGLEQVPRVQTGALGWQGRALSSGDCVLALTGALEYSSKNHGVGCLVRG
jgi:hypothetical protein